MSVTTSFQKKVHKNFRIKAVVRHCYRHICLTARARRHCRRKRWPNRWPNARSARARGSIDTSNPMTPPRSAFTIGLFLSLYRACLLSHVLPHVVTLKYGRKMRYLSHIIRDQQSKVYLPNLQLSNTHRVDNTYL